MAEATCIGCRFFVRVRPEDKRGQCRRRSPVLDIAGPQTRTLWPMTPADAFCGEHDARWPERPARILEQANG